MRKLFALTLAVLVTGCALSPTVPTSTVHAKPPASLVGAWEVTATRTRGVGKNLLTFSSDGTFFRSGDTHPVLSGGHGAWKQVGSNLHEASYVAFAFDSSGKWVGINRNNLQIHLSESGDSFRGTVKSSNRDLQDIVLTRGVAPLEGRRIQVLPFE